MATVNPVGTTTTTASASAKNPTTAIDKDTFLKLLVAQLQHQDPMQPSDSSQWTAQMAQFSTVEQLTNLAQNSADAAKASQVNQAVSLLGRTVTYDDKEGLATTGKVERVDLSDGVATLTIDGQTGISPSALHEVA
jgi:flagellar basal-body rod modification protein FlgD